MQRASALRKGRTTAPWLFASGPLKRKSFRVSWSAGFQPAGRGRILRPPLPHSGGKRVGQRQTPNGGRFSAASPTSLPFRHFSLWQSSSNPAKSLRKGCGKTRAQSNVQKMWKRRGKSAESPAELLRETG